MNISVMNLCRDLAQWCPPFKTRQPQSFSIPCFWTEHKLILYPKKHRLPCGNVKPCASRQQTRDLLCMQVYQLATIYTLNHDKSKLRDPQKRNRLSQPRIDCNLFPTTSEGQNSLISQTCLWTTDLSTFAPAYHCNWLKSNKTSMKHPPKTLTLLKIYSIPLIILCIFRTCLSSYHLPALCTLSLMVTSMNLLPATPFIFWLMIFSENERSDSWKVNCLSCWSLAEVVASKSWVAVPQESSPLGFHTDHSSKGQ